MVLGYYQINWPDRRDLGVEQRCTCSPMHTMQKMVKIFIFRVSCGPEWLQTHYIVKRVTLNS